MRGTRVRAAAISLNIVITVHNNAVSSFDGKQVTFHGNEKNPGGTGIKDVVSDTHRVETSNIVTTVTLDNLFLGKVESIPFMKIDTEGHEHEVLKSAKLLLSRDIIKYLVVEIRRHQTQMVIFLYENRFTCRLLDYKKKTSSGSGIRNVKGRNWKRYGPRYVASSPFPIYFVATSERDSSWTCNE